MVSNNADTSNDSDGTAEITTGDAAAVGVLAEHQTSISRSRPTSRMTASSSPTRTPTSKNDGDAVADTGDNDATGNKSDNDADNRQDADAEDGDGDTVVTNNADTSNDSDGKATIDTGDATAFGVVADTDIDQSVSADIEDDGFRHHRSGRQGEERRRRQGQLRPQRRCGQQVGQRR